MMGELIKLREQYEQSETGRISEVNEQVDKATEHLVHEVETLRSELDSLKGELSSKESEFSQAKAKREAIIKDIKRENGNITEQFIAANSERNRLKSEIERLREDVKKNQSYSQNNLHKYKELADQKDELERELLKTNDQLKKVISLEDELNEIKTKKLPEKEKQIQNYSNTVAELNREKLNNYRDVRTLYDKYMKMEQDCQTNLNIAKEWQNEVDRLQGKMEKYQKVVGQLERELKTAKTQANRMSLNTSEVATDKNTSDELLSNDALLKIRQKYPLQRGNSGNFSGN